MSSNFIKIQILSTAILIYDQSLWSAVSCSTISNNPHDIRHLLLKLLLRQWKLFLRLTWLLLWCRWRTSICNLYLSLWDILSAATSASRAVSGLGICIPLTHAFYEGATVSIFSWRCCLSVDMLVKLWLLLLLLFLLSFFLIRTLTWAAVIVVCIGTCSTSIGGKFYRRLVIFIYFVLISRFDTDACIYILNFWFRLWSLLWLGIIILPLLLLALYFLLQLIQFFLHIEDGLTLSRSTSWWLWQSPTISWQAPRFRNWSLTLNRPMRL